jgi:hypothetical protein
VKGKYQIIEFISIPGRDVIARCAPVKMYPYEVYTSDLFACYIKEVC